MSESKNPKKIVVLSLSGIGNFIMQSPVFSALRSNYPGCHITAWVAPRGTKALAMANTNIDEVIEAPIKQSLFGHFKLVWQLAKARFDIGIVLSPGQLWKSAAYLFLAGIPTRIGNTYLFNNKKNSSFLLTHGIQEEPGLHDSEQNLRLLEPLGLDISGESNYELPIPPDEQAKADMMFTDFLIDEDKKVIGIHTGSAPDFLWKRWPIENFIVVCKELIENHNAHVLIFGGPDEINDKQAVKDALGDDASVVSAGLITTAALMKRCKLMLSNDSGLMHVAAAVGIPTFGLFGPTDEKLTGPRGKFSYVIRAPRTEPVYDTEKNYILGDKPHATMTAITPELVMDHLASVL